MLTVHSTARKHLLRLVVDLCCGHGATYLADSNLMV